MNLPMEIGWTDGMTYGKTTKAKTIKVNLTICNKKNSFS